MKYRLSRIFRAAFSQAGQDSSHEPQLPIAIIVGTTNYNTFPYRKRGKAAAAATAVEEQLNGCYRALGGFRGFGESWDS